MDTLTFKLILFLSAQRTIKKYLHIIKNYWMRLSRTFRIIQTEVSVICRSEAEADNADLGLNNSDILRKPNSIILL